MTDNFKNMKDKRSPSSRPKKKPKLGSGDDFKEDDPLLRKFIKMSYLSNVLGELENLKNSEVSSYYDDMNHIYSERENSIAELLSEDDNVDNMCYLITRLVKIEVGNLLLKFEFNKVTSSKKKLQNFRDMLWHVDH